MSPYRPFKGGHATFSTTSTDYVTPFSGSVVTYTQRQEAGVTDFQQATDLLRTAASQVVQAVEEVRAATRQLRQSRVGYSVEDAADYAGYQASVDSR